MDEQRMNAYVQLIQRLLECPNGEEGQILNDNIELIEPGFLQAIIAVAKKFDDNGNQNAANFLTNLAWQLGEWLGSDRQETSIRKQTADILFKWGGEQYYISRFVVALGCWQHCLSIYQAIQDRQGEADSLGLLGLACDSLGEYELALNCHKKSLTISQEIKDCLGEVYSLNNIGKAYQCLGQYERALNYCEQHLAISQKIKDRKEEMAAWANLALVYYSLKQYKQALDFYERSLDISREIKDRQGEATALGGLGSTYNSLEQYERALNDCKKCLAISREIEYRQGEATALGGLGIVYYFLGKIEEAINYYKQQFLICREIKDRQGEAASLNNISNACHSLGQFKKAIDYDKHYLAISREIKDRQGEATALKNLGSAYHCLGQFKRAIDCNKQSLYISREIKDRQGEATALGALGGVYFSLVQVKKAIDQHKQHLAISREIKDRQGEATALTNLGSSYRFLGRYQLAINYHKKSLAISRELKDRQGEATALGNLGSACYSLGQVEQAIKYYKKSLAIFKEFKMPLREGEKLIQLGLSYSFLGESQVAIKYYKESLVLCRKIGYRQGEANSLGNLGSACYSLGEYEQSIDFYEQSLAINREIGYRQGEAASLGGLGNAYRSLEEYERAKDNYEDSLDIYIKIEDPQGEATILGCLGSLYLFLRNYERSQEHYKQSLAISRRIKNPQGEAEVLGNLGSVCLFGGQYEQAKEHYEQSLTLYKKIKDFQGKATFLANLGNVYLELQQPEKAIQSYRDSLKIATPETMPPECSKVGRNLGNINFTQGDWQLALEGYEPAMQAVEQLRKGSTTDKRRQEIIKEAISVYANAVQCYINLKQYDKAVETADRSRSRHLADLFYSSKDLYPKGEIPPEVEAYYRLQQQSDRLRSSENDGIKPLTATRQPTPNGEAILEKIKELEAEKQQAWLKIRSKDQVLAGQLQPDPLSFKDMQALIPDAETAILNFYTTGEHTHIFILRQNQTTQLHTCEGQGLETLQNWLFNNWLKPYKENETAWQNQMGEFLHELTNRLQINQLIEQHLNGIKELIIIPHLSLHQIPFAALPLTEVYIPYSDTASVQTRGSSLDLGKTEISTKTPPQQPEYLSERFRIRIVPSCQILNFCHQRGNLKPATMGIVENTKGDLVFTGYECQTLATKHKVTPDNRLQYQQATISNYQNLVNRVQVLHSSHHASSQLDNSLESKLLLFDGEINLGRIFTWRFADLAEVFLSCCETNLTFTQITDDPLSIASGFLCAGARNVVSTLWAVDDLATALFCILYYEEKQEKSRSEAIRQAQLKLRNLTCDELSGKYKLLLEDYFEQQKGEKQTEIVKNMRLRLELLCRETLPFVSPYYWSGFVSQGLA